MVSIFSFLRAVRWVFLVCGGSVLLGLIFAYYVVVLSVILCFVNGCFYCVFG